MKVVVTSSLGNINSPSEGNGHHDVAEVAAIQFESAIADPDLRATLAEVSINLTIVMY
jgi:hypothetical protein